MKDKKHTILCVIFIVLLFVAVLVTSILISQKQNDLDKIPDANSQVVILEENYR